MAQNVSILRVPPYHPELQPIEACWAVVKNYMAEHCDFTMQGLRKRLPEAFARVSPEIVQEIIAKGIEREDKDWSEDETLDNQYALNAEEEYTGRKLFGEEGLTHYLDHG